MMWKLYQLQRNPKKFIFNWENLLLSYQKDYSAVSQFFRNGYDKKRD